LESGKVKLLKGCTTIANRERKKNKINNGVAGEVKVKVSNFDFASLLFIFYLFIYSGENNITFIKEKNSLHFKLLSSK
jgi:hypothetical protein